MNLKFNKKQIGTILEKYYKEQELIIGKVTIKEITCEVGFTMYPHDDVLVNMKINGEMNLNGLKVAIKKEIQNEDLEKAIKYFLSEFEQEVDKISYDKGFHYKSEGYGMCERTVQKAYFNGVEVTLKNKTKKIGGM